jgi:ribonuclease HI
MSSTDKNDFLKALKVIELSFTGSKAKKSKSIIKRLKDLYLESDLVTSGSSLSTLYALPKETANSNYNYCVFSDGGCRGNPGPGAWGAMVQDMSGAVIYEGSEFTEKTTNNRMELIGAIAGMKHAKQIGGECILLVSDSKYVLEGIRSWLDGWKKRGWKKADKKEPENLDLWKEIDILKSSFKTLDCKWVKGHTGHPQNERCDELANKAMDEGIS